jgi:hypothetical protein
MTAMRVEEARDVEVSTSRLPLVDGGHFGTFRPAVPKFVQRITQDDAEGASEVIPLTLSVEGVPCFELAVIGQQLF